MKKLLISLSLLLCTATVFATNDLPSPKSSVKPIDQIAAVVNDAVITQSEVDKYYENAVHQLTKQGIAMPSESTMKKEILNQLIYQKLQLQLAKRNHITVTNAQVDETIKRIAQQHKISVAKLKQKITEQGGVSFSDYRHEIKKQIAITMIQHQALAKDIQVSNAEVDAFLNQYKTQNKFAQRYHLVDVLIPLPSTPTKIQIEQAQTEAQNIIKKLNHGANIHTIEGAEINDLGFQTKTDLPNLFADQLTHMKPGSIVGPLRAANGIHILKLEQIKKSKAKLPSREQVKRMLVNKKFQKALGNWVKMLRKQSFVKVVNPQ